MFYHCFKFICYQLCYVMCLPIMCYHCTTIELFIYTNIQTIHAYWHDVLRMLLFLLYLITLYLLYTKHYMQYKTIWYFIEM